MVFFMSKALEDITILRLILTSNRKGKMGFLRVPYYFYISKIRNPV